MINACTIKNEQNSPNYYLKITKFHLQHNEINHKLYLKHMTYHRQSKKIKQKKTKLKKKSTNTTNFMSFQQLKLKQNKIL